MKVLTTQVSILREEMKAYFSYEFLNKKYFLIIITINCGNYKKWLFLHYKIKSLHKIR